MDTEKFKLVIELLRQQLMFELLEDAEAFQAQLERTQNAMRTILMERDGHLTIELDYSDNMSRLNLTASIDVKVELDEKIPDYLPPDIFIELHGRSVDEMIKILRSYQMPESEINPFLRRIIPADDSY